MSAGPTTADSGSPPPSALPNVTTSGTMPSCWKACSRPVRARPTLTSSHTSGTPAARHASCTARRKPSGGTTSPPSERIGSTIRQATLPVASAPDRCEGGGGIGLDRRRGQGGTGSGTARAPGPDRRVAGLDLLAGDAHRQSQPAVVAVLERDDGAPARRMPAGAQGDVVGVGAGMAEIDAALPAALGGRHPGEQILGEADRVRVDRGEAARTGRGAHRAGDGLHDGGMAMAEAGRRPRRGEVDELAAGRIERGSRRVPRRPRAGRTAASPPRRSPGRHARAARS